MASKMSGPQALFDDMASRAPDFAEALSKIDRPIRIATMCSGTESPLLALQMLKKSVMDQYGVQLRFEHEFSCEIQPFKQAYIERNFAPAILFRDVRELGNEYATTAYGSLVKVPGADLLVAGTSCVDYSALNNDKKGIDAGGESGATFHGMIAWVKRHQPKIVILENVVSAPWPTVKGKFEGAGYTAQFTRLDTKNYLIPHTRTRGYLMATLNQDPGVGDVWKAKMKTLESPLALTLQDFLLQEDDVRLQEARHKMVKAKELTKSRPRVEWNRCELRHEKARLDEDLGNKRPLTHWQQGNAHLPDFAWSDWASGQTDRVMDLADITYLRAAKTGVDISHKTFVFNLSQNVDRTSGSTARPGITSCLTPCMIPYVSSRGGPVTGLEALALQGLPINDLSLTRETEEQIADLAGNAMSSTVVGAAIMAAITLNADLLSSGDHMEVEATEAPPQQLIDECTVTTPLDIFSPHDIDTEIFLRSAHGSSKLCACENGGKLTESTIFKCGDCGHTCCEGCISHPEHAFVKYDIERTDPNMFEEEFKSQLPTVVRLSDDGPTFNFTGVIRSHDWIARYIASDDSCLQLIISRESCDWYLYTKVPRGDIRILPVARSHGFNGDNWQVFDLTKHEIQLSIQGSDPVPAWEATIGLVGHHSDRWASLQITASTDVGIDGSYKLLDKCGGANGTLYKSGPTFFFLDPTHCGSPSDDQFVFADTHERMPYDIQRLVRLALPGGWRLDYTQHQQIKCVVEGAWRETDAYHLSPVASTGIVRTPVSVKAWSQCSEAHVCIHCEVACDQQDTSAWAAVEGGKHPKHIMERLAIPEAMQQWNSVEIGDACEVCHPRKPDVVWVRAKAKLEPVEDAQQSATFEHALKSRPQPFIIEAKGSVGTQHLRVAINPATLIHRAHGLLGGKGTSDAAWRVAKQDTQIFDSQPLTLTSNRDDAEAPQPPHFTRFPLRPEQLRSLTWMLQQEASTQPFYEEETCEAIIPSMGWRLEGRVTSAVEVRGGVLADQVGYGKTAITLGLISASSPATGPADSPGFFSTKATLVIAPPHLMKQWPSEITKFTGNSFKVRAIRTLGDLVRLSIKDMQDSDIVVCSASMLRSDSYYERLRQFSGGKQIPKSAGRMFDHVYGEALSNLRARVDLLKEGNIDAVEALLAADSIERSAEVIAEKPKTKSQVYKSKDDDQPKVIKKPKTQQRSTDPFSFAKARNLFTNMTCPLLEMFHWNRIVVDEYTYIEDEKTAVTLLRGQYRWCLSGTPPTAGFADVNGIASFLGTKLGVSDSMEFKQMSKVDMFRHFSQTFSTSWHARRHQLAQEFMDRFVRQNVAEIDQIPFHHETLAIELPPAERAIYVELDAHLQLLDMKSAKKFSKTNVSDREERLTAILGSSSSAEEALVKRCSFFEGGEDMCASIAEKRWEQFRSCMDDFRDKIVQARVLWAAIVRVDAGYDTPSEPFSRWHASLETEACGDGDARLLFKEEAAKAFEVPIVAIDTITSKNMSDKVFELRELVHDIRRLQKECVGRLRSVKFFKGVRGFQGACMETCTCGEASDAILASCGHTGCYACIVDHAEKQMCGTAGCHASVRVSDIMRASELGSAHAKTGKHGAKITALIDLVKEIPADERALVFVQFEDLMAHVATALEEAGIKALQLRGSVHQRTAKLEAFQSGEAKILLLDVAGESASGANLTVANHVIFYHPLVTSSKQQFVATRTQAIGRAVRYGQTREVKITHLVTQGTIDADIMEAMA